LSILRDLETGARKPQESLETVLRRIAGKKNPLAVTGSG
jgi:hypothetical protein